MFDNILNIAHLGNIESLTVTSGDLFIVKWSANDFYWQIEDEPVDGWFQVIKMEPFYTERNHNNGESFKYLEWHCIDQNDYYINQDGVVLGFNEFLEIRRIYNK